MRACVAVAMLLLFVPASGAWQPEIPVGNFSKEWVVIDEDGWNYSKWVALREQGVEPLRQISKTEVLVWGSSTYVQFVGVETLDLLRGGYSVEGYRVILEPRLPSDAQWSILSQFNFEGLQLAGVQSALPTSFEVRGIDPGVFNEIPGVWWVEPLLETSGRNELSSSIMEHNSMDSHPAWDLGLNGSGVIIGVADSGIELDHGCFRENGTSLGNVGQEHRKVVLVNTSIGDGDMPGENNYRHGTHIAGSLVCDLWHGNVSVGTSPSHGARVLFQDVVNDSGWSEPTVDWLLAEAFMHGVIIHSDSWGDDTEAYTLRSSEFDLWHREVPWSLAFIAPGNNPSKFYEPANARNVVSVGGSLHDNSSNLYSSSSRGPTEEGLRGNFIVAPASGIVSASADGNVSSFNDDMRSSSGTSMSTPLGASITAVMQQMVQDGWFTEDGFVPSGPLLRALLALSADSMGVSLAPDAQQGWGRPNLANLIDFDDNSSVNVWVHDSFRMVDGNQSELAAEWLAANGTRPLEQVTGSLWNGTGAVGPFLKEGENVSWNLSLVPGENLEVLLSFNQRPFGSVSDDLNLIVELPNGTRISSNDDLEGTESVWIAASNLSGFETVVVEVHANLVGVGNYTDVLGVDGDMLGFALAAKGTSGIQPEPEPVAGPESVMIGPLSRQAELQYPVDQAEDELLPLVIALHGFSYSPEYVYDFFQGPESVTENRHLLLTPTGTENPEGKYFWNGPPACCDFYNQNIDDVGYISSLIDTVVNYWGADPEHVMLIGHSNGGFMSHRMACDAGNKIHTIVNFAGATYGDFSQCNLTGYPNIINAHGTVDSTVDYNGGEFLGESYASSPGGAAFWAERSGCDEFSTLVGTLDLVGVGGNETRQQEHLNCTQGNRIAHWKLMDEGHVPIFPEGSLINAAFDWAFNSDDAQSTNGGGVVDEFDECNHSGWEQDGLKPIVEDNGCTCSENNNNTLGTDHDGDGWKSCLDPCPDVYGWIDGCLGDKEDVGSENVTLTLDDGGGVVSTMLCGFLFIGVLIAIPAVLVRLLSARENKDVISGVPDPFFLGENEQEE